jgi:hypothetical protein
MTQLGRSSRRSSGRQSGRSSRRSSARCGSRDVVLEIGSRDVMRAVAYHGEIGTFAVIQPVRIALGDQSWQRYILGLGDRREGLWSQPADFGVFARLRERRARWRGRSQGVHSWHSVNSSGLRRSSGRQSGRSSERRSGRASLSHLQQLERVLARPEQQTVTQRPILMRIRIEPCDAQRTQRLLVIG